MSEVEENKPIPVHRSYTLDNVQTEIEFALEVRLPYAIVDDKAYCVFDRYECKPMGRVPEFDRYEYKCPNCGNKYAIPGQAFVDWCKFRGDIVR